MLRLGSKNVSKLFLGGRAIANAYLGNKLVWQASQPLPYDAEVEYLQSTGAQYIDTGLKASNTTSVTTRVAWTDVSGYDKVAFGADNGSTFNAGFVLQVSGIGAFFRFVRGNQYKDYNSNPKPVVDKFYDISVGPNGMDVDGYFLAITDTSAFTTTGNLPLFAWRRGANIINFGTVKIGPTKIFVDVPLVRDYIPVRFTNEQGVSEGAMYDRVSGALFRNAGTGAFVVGPDINPISARSYVNDGLIAMWDGIENAGWGQHNSSATTWKDLIGTNDLDTMNSNTFGDNCALITDARLGIGSSDKHIDLYTGTVEMVCEAAPMERASFLRLGNTNSSSYSLGISYTNTPGGVS